MRSNYFDCWICGKRTRHIEVPYREYEAYRQRRNLSFVERVGAHIYESTGIDKLERTLNGTNYWKCSVCGRISERNLLGEDV